MECTGWDGLLEDGETILWQGQPVPGIVWRDVISPMGLFGAVFTAFALFWMAMAAAIIGGDAGFPFTLFPLFGLPFLAVGLYMMLGHVIVDGYVRSATHYTLTDRTAFIATDAFGKRSLKSYPIREMPFLELEDGMPGSVMFWEEELRRARRSPARPGARVRHATATRNSVGFRRIDAAREVYRMLREARGALNFADRQARD